MVHYPSLRSCKRMNVRYAPSPPLKFQQSQHIYPAHLSGSDAHTCLHSFHHTCPDTLPQSSRRTPGQAKERIPAPCLHALLAMHLLSHAGSPGSAPQQLHALPRVPRAYHRPHTTARQPPSTPQPMYPLHLQPITSTAIVSHPAPQIPVHHTYCKRQHAPFPTPPRPLYSAESTPTPRPPNPPAPVPCRRSSSAARARCTECRSACRSMRSAR